MHKYKFSLLNTPSISIWDVYNYDKPFNNANGYFGSALDVMMYHLSKCISYFLFDACKQYVYGCRKLIMSTDGRQSSKVRRVLDMVYFRFLFYSHSVNVLINK
mgnify:FL=1